MDPQMIHLLQSVHNENGQAVVNAVKLLQDGGDHLRLQGLYKLWAACHFPEYCKEVVRDGAILKVVKLLEGVGEGKEDADVTLCCAIFANVFKIISTQEEEHKEGKDGGEEHAELKKKLVDSRTIPVLMATIKRFPKSLNLQLAGWEAVAAGASVKEFYTVLRDEGAVEHLTSILENVSDEQAPAIQHFFQALSQLMIPAESPDPFGKDGSGALGATLKLMKNHSKDDNVQVAGFRVIGQFAAFNDDAVDILHKNGGFSLLFDSISSKLDPKGVNAIIVVSELLEKTSNAQLVDDAVASPLVKGAFNVMKEYGSDREVLFVSLKIFKSLAKHDKLRAQLEEEESVSDAVMAALKSQEKREPVLDIAATELFEKMNLDTSAIKNYKLEDKQSSGFQWEYLLIGASVAAIAAAYYFKKK